MNSALAIMHQNIRLDDTNHGWQLFWVLSVFGLIDSPAKNWYFEKKQKIFSAQHAA